MIGKKLVNDIVYVLKFINKILHTCIIRQINMKLLMNEIIILIIGFALLLVANGSCTKNYAAK